MTGRTFAPNRRAIGVEPTWIQRLDSAGVASIPTLTGTLEHPRKRRRRKRSGRFISSWIHVDGRRLQIEEQLREFLTSPARHVARDSPP
jgi:hypothetical protein